MKNQLKKSSALLAALVFLTACGASPEEISSSEITAKKVSAQKIVFQEITPTVSVSGTLRPAVESMVAAESSGTVASIFVSEGDRVEIGAPLLSFSTGDNLAASDLSASQVSLENAEKSLALARQKATKDAEISTLSLRNAEKNLESAKKSGSSTGISLDSQKASAESSVNLAKISLENAKRNLTDIQKNLDLSEKNLAQNSENIKATAFANFRPAMTALDQILGASEERKEEAKIYTTMLGFKDPETFQVARNTLREMWNAFTQIDAQFSADSKSISLAATISLGEKIRFALQKTDEMLQKTIAGPGLSEATFASFRSSVSASRNATEGQIAQLTATEQAISDFNTKKPQSLRSAEAAVESATEQLSQAERGLTQVKSGGDVSRVGTETAIINAENALETAKIQAEISAKQNEMAIQSAASARDSVASALNSAQIRYGKLSTSSPISGVVIEKSVELGNTVNAGAPLFVIAKIDTLKLTADVPVDILPSLALGDAAQILVDVFGEKTGKISKIFPVADAATRRINLEISLENPTGEIPANIFATANINLPVQKNIILIPRSALISQNPPTLFVLVDGKAQKRMVKLGIDSGTQVEILEGLSEGEFIIPDPILGLTEGDTVEFDLTSDDIPKTESLPNITEKTEEKPALVDTEEDLRSVASEEIILEKPIDATHFSQSPIVFRGTAPVGSAFVTINDYRLTSFSSLDLSFQYFADSVYKNLKSGENHFVIAAFDKNEKKLAQKEITLFFDQ